MAADVRQSGLVKRLGSRLDSALGEVAHREIKEKFQRLPGGITNGVARLTKCYIGEVAAGKAKAGELFWRAEGVVLSPDSVTANGQRVNVKGQTTSIMVMLCDTGEAGTDRFTPFKDNVGKACDEMRLLGANFTAKPTGTELETVCKALERAKPFFKFETRESPETKNPDGTVKYAARVWETWYGTRGLEDYDPADDTAAGVTDGQTAGDDGSGGGDATTTSAPDPDDLDALVAAAGGDDDSAAADAGERLIALAIECGCDEDEARKADDWADVKTMIEQAREGAAAEPAKPAPKTAAPAGPKYKKGDVILHHKLDKDGKPEKGPNKKVKPKIEWEITKVDAAKKTADLLDNDTKKIKMAGVAFDALELPAY